MRRCRPFLTPSDVGIQHDRHAFTDILVLSPFLSVYVCPSQQFAHVSEKLCVTFTQCAFVILSQNNAEREQHVARNTRGLPCVRRGDDLSPKLEPLSTQRAQCPNPKRRRVEFPKASRSLVFVRAGPLPIVEKSGTGENPPFSPLPGGQATCIRVSVASIPRSPTYSPFPKKKPGAEHPARRWRCRAPVIW